MSVHKGAKPVVRNSATVSEMVPSAISRHFLYECDAASREGRCTQTQQNPLKVCRRRRGIALLFSTALPVGWKKSLAAINDVRGLEACKGANDTNEPVEFVALWLLQRLDREALRRLERRAKDDVKFEDVGELSKDVDCSLALLSRIQSVASFGLPDLQRTELDPFAAFRQSSERKRRVRHPTSDCSHVLHCLGSDPGTLCVPLEQWPPRKASASPALAHCGTVSDCHQAHHARKRFGRSIPPSDARVLGLCLSPRYAPRLLGRIPLVDTVPWLLSGRRRYQRTTDRSSVPSTGASRCTALLGSPRKRDLQT